MSKAEERMKPRWFDTYQGPQQGYTVDQFRALDASHQRLKEALHRLEVSANTVKYCYSNRPENFAAALMSLQDDAESARAALEQAKDLS